MYWIKRKIWQIKNLIKWFPVIWNQYDFDESYAIEVFIFQLNKIADFLDSDKACTVSAKANASCIRKTTKLLQDVMDEKFAMEYQNNFKECYGEVKFKFESTDNPKLNQLKWKFPTIDGMTEEELDKIYTKMFHESQAKQEKAHNLAWRLVANHIRGWWD